MRPSALAVLTLTAISNLISAHGEGWRERTLAFGHHKDRTPGTGERIMLGRLRPALVCLLALMAILPCSAMAQTLRPEDLLRVDVPPADHRLAYGADPLQFGELRLPKAIGSHAVAIIIHGGCWADRLPGLDPRSTGFEPLRPLAAALTHAGIATWNVEYRRVGTLGGGWPGTFEDLARATDFLRIIAPKYDLDLGRVASVGHSAGGQLALWIAARPKLPAASPVSTKNALAVRAAVDIDGPPDLASAQPKERTFCPVSAITRLLDGTPADHPERYRQSSALAWLPLGLPQTIIVGSLLESAGDLVTDYRARANAKGDNVAVITLNGSGHFGMLLPDTEYAATVQAEILSLLK